MDYNIQKVLVTIGAYFLLLPISIMISVIDGFGWENNLGILMAPILVAFYGIKRRKEKLASTNLIIALLVIFGFMIVLVPSSEILDSISPMWLIYLQCLLVLGAIIVVHEFLKQRKNKKEDFEGRSNKV